MINDFDYGLAFSRNIGWITHEEQYSLKNKRIAIAGLGGVGGSHLLTLTRLGIGNFNVADFDSFELPNFNRQAGALISNLSKPKVDILANMALDINPTLGIKKFSQGVSIDNIKDFFTDVDLYVDGLDFYAFSAREAVFDYCAKNNIPAVTVAPIGMGAALLNFMPGCMTFEEYFKFKGKTEDEKGLYFLMGLSPSMLQKKYLVDMEAFDFKKRKAPSTPMGCDLSAGVAATQALKILLNRGKIFSAPWGLHYDAYENILVKTWRPWGNRNPLQQLAIRAIKKKLNI